MHILQRKILQIIDSQDISQMTLRDIGDLIGEGRDNPQKVKHHLQQLVKKGFLRFSNNKYQKVEANSREASSLVSLPILGSANCGEALSVADDHVEGYLQVSPRIVADKDNLFVVRAKGDSMNRASVSGSSIDDGDYVIVDASDKIPEDNDYVLSVIDGAANIKKFKKDTDREMVILASESSSKYDPIYIHQDDLDLYSVAGKVVSVLKV